MRPICSASCMTSLAVFSRWRLLSIRTRSASSGLSMSRTMTGTLSNVSAHAARQPFK